jgi:hypothetical protein
VTLTPRPHRVFRREGVSFSYPRSFTFETALEDTDSRSWKLSGNDFRIMLFVLADRLTPRAFAENLVDVFGRGNCELADAAPLGFGDAELSGTSLNILMAGTRIVQDVYGMPARGPWTRLLVLQDSLDEAGRRSAEGRAALGLLTQSSRFVSPPERPSRADDAGGEE